jgi:hypothetical protein
VCVPQTSCMQVFATVQETIRSVCVWKGFLQHSLGSSGTTNMQCRLRTTCVSDAGL